MNRRMKGSGSITERRGKWQISVYDGIDKMTGKKIHRYATCADKEEAEHLLSKMLVARGHGSVSEQFAGSSVEKRNIERENDVNNNRRLMTFSRLERLLELNKKREKLLSEYAVAYPILNINTVTKDNGKKDDVDRLGEFYIVQIIPDIYPQRIKMGFSGNIIGRLATYLTVSPTADVLGVWPCMRSMEGNAIAYLTKEGCKQLGEEVFDFNIVKDITFAADLFFYYGTWREYT